MRDLLRPERRLLVVALVAMGLHAVTTGLYAYLVGPLLAFSFTGGAEGYDAFFVFLPWFDPSSLDRAALTWALPAVVLGVSAFKGVAYYFQLTRVGLLGENIGASLRLRVFDAILRAEQPPLPARGDVATRVGSDIELVQQGTVESVTAAARDGLTLLVLMGLAIWLDWRLALLAFVVLPLAILPIARFSKRIRSSTRDGLNARGRLAGQLVEALVNRVLLQKEDARNAERERFEAEVDGLRRARLRAIVAKAINHPVMELLGVGGLAATLWYAGFRIWDGSLQPAQFVSFFAAVLMLYEPLKGLSRAVGHSQEAQAALERLRPLLEATPLPSGPKTPGMLDTLVLDGTELWHGDKRIVHGSLTISAGTTVLITGPSGAGKTTLLHALVGLHVASSGRVLWNGLPLAEYTRGALAARIGFLDQDARCFGRSVRENLTLGAMFSDEELAQALTEAGAHEFVMARGGLDSDLVEGADDLSGGQRRRLALARTLLGAPDLIVLDEPTDAVDPAVEAHILRTLRARAGQVTMVIVAHRTDQVPWADLVIEVCDGALEMREGHRAVA